MNNPSWVRVITAFIAGCAVAVGRPMEHFGSDGLRKSHGSGMWHFLVGG